MDDSSASYIYMVQHLIEKCLIFHMTKEECMEALSKHADIKPVITSTVWKELEKENKEFFEAYSKAKSSEDRSCLTTIIHLLGNSYDNGNHILGHPGEGMMWHNIIGAATA